ncbi:hypothetical protein GCM10007276_12500 [Agaricicola taiwanensis]|uniref:Uncharacterized protein n=1 Tax=Agaricicola taiwanensis TaxID=591372 RepID=A0A8J2VPN7_9RHOB|nr:hypothetical protein [Agaricicola taiwanensis]GGE36511.1 hypothetical protein GCM10007276_12500 [Agaricicola taiwanensis]
MTLERAAKLERLDIISAVREALLTSGLSQESVIIADEAATRAITAYLSASKPAGDVEALPDREEIIFKAVGLCNRIPGATHWNAAEFAYDAIAAALASQAVSEPSPRVDVRKECETCTGTGVVENTRAYSGSNGGFDPCPDCSSPRADDTQAHRVNAEVAGLVELEREVRSWLLPGIQISGALRSTLEDVAAALSRLAAQEPFMWVRHIADIGPKAYFQCWKDDFGAFPLFAQPQPALDVEKITRERDEWKQWAEDWHSISEAICTILGLGQPDAEDVVSLVRGKFEAAEAKVERLEKALEAKSSALRMAEGALRHSQPKHKLDPQAKENHARALKDVQSSLTASASDHQQ